MHNIFSHEKRLAEYNSDEEKLKALKAEYADIVDRLKELLQAGSLSVYTEKTIMEMSGRVLENIARKYGKVREGVKSVMGGKILEYEAKTIKREGIKEGIREGIREGIEEGIYEGMLKTLFDLVRKNLLSVRDAALQAELTEDVFLAKMQAYKG